MKECESKNKTDAKIEQHIISEANRLIFELEEYKEKTGSYPRLFNIDKQGEVNNLDLLIVDLFQQYIDAKNLPTMILLV
jgi:hypothetical protein